MSDASRHILYAIAESTYGVCPASPAFLTKRHIGCTLGFTKQAMISEELRADRQIEDYRHGAKSVGGNVDAEMSYGSHDELYEATLCGTWAAKVAPYSATTISAAASDNSINDSANGLPLLDPGDKITTTGFTGGGAGNNQVKLVVVSSTVSKLVVSGGTALVDAAASPSVTVTTLTNTLMAGVVRRSFSLLRNFADQTTGQLPFHLLTGVEFNKLDIDVKVESLIKVTFGVVGQAMALSDTAPASSTFTAVNTNPLVDTFTGTIYEGGTALATVTELKLTLDNGIAPRFVIGSDTTINPSIGRSNGTGQVTAFFENAALLQKFLGQTESSIVLFIKDGLGNGIRLKLPRLKYNGGQPDTKGQGPIMIALPFQLIRDTVSGSNIILERIAA
jgi:hypothetical protein